MQRPTLMRGLVAVLSLSCAVLPVAAGSGASAAVAVAPANLVDFVINPDGTVVMGHGTGATVPNAFPTPPTVVSNSSWQAPDAACGESHLSFTAVVAGRITKADIEFTEFPGQCPGAPAPTTALTTGTAGWGTMRQLVDANGYLYGLTSTGSLNRYQKLGGVSYRSAGSLPGYSSVRSMALAHSDSRKDVLLINTSAGALQQVTIPTSRTMATTIAPVRTRSWQGFEQLLTSPTQRGTIQLQGVDRGTGDSYRYDLGPLRGTATSMTALGLAGGPSLTTPLFQAGSFDGFPYRGAP